MALPVSFLSVHEMPELPLTPENRRALGSKRRLCLIAFADYGDADPGFKRKPRQKVLEKAAVAQDCRRAQAETLVLGNKRAGQNKSSQNEKQKGPQVPSPDAISVRLQA